MRTSVNIKRAGRDAGIQTRDSPTREEVGVSVGDDAVALHRTVRTAAVNWPLPASGRHSDPVSPGEGPRFLLEAG